MESLTEYGENPKSQLHYIACFFIERLQNSQAPQFLKGTKPIPCHWFLSIPPENISQRYSDGFRGCRKRPVTLNALTIAFPKFGQSTFLQHLASLMLDFT